MGVVWWGRGLGLLLRTDMQLTFFFMYLGEGVSLESCDDSDLEDKQYWKLGDDTRGLDVCEKFVTGQMIEKFKSVHLGSLCKYIPCHRDPVVRGFKAIILVILE